MSASTARAIRVGLAGLWLLVAGFLGVTASVATGVAVDIWVGTVLAAVIALGLAVSLVVGRGQPVIRLSLAVGTAGVLVFGALALASDSGFRLGSLLFAFVFVAINATSIGLLASHRAPSQSIADSTR